MPSGDLPYVAPEKDVVVLEIIGDGPSADGRNVRLDDWLSYRFNSHFLTPTDGWSFELASDILTDKERAACVPGAEVRLTVNGHVQGAGYIDHITYSASRSSGSVWNVEGRDKLSPVVDANADPTVQFNKSQSLYDVIVGIFRPFGWFRDEDFLVENGGNINVITGETRGVRVSKKKGKLLKNFEEHRLRPHQNEGAFAFAARILARHGLFLWLSAEGNILIISRPCYEPAPGTPVPDLAARLRYSLVRKKDGTGNILDGSVTRNLCDQPSAIVADCSGGGGEFGHGQFKCVMVNPTIETPDQKAFEEFWVARGAIVLDATFVGDRIKCKTPRPMYLHDSESHTREQLESYVRREMSLRMRKSLECRYTVEGHVLNGNIIAVDTLCHVNDEASGVNEIMYVLGRTFHKSRIGGTTTEIELIRPFTMEF